MKQKLCVVMVMSVVFAHNVFAQAPSTLLRRDTQSRIHEGPVGGNALTLGGGGFWMVPGEKSGSDAEERVVLSVNAAEFAATEANALWVRYGWKVAVKNESRERQIFNVEVQFLDSNDFVIDTAYRYRQTIAPFNQLTVTGDRLVTMPGASRVARIKAIVTK